MDKIIWKLKNISVKGWAVIAVVCVLLIFGANKGRTATQEMEITSQYSYSATIDVYPGVVISSNSREELDAVIDILLHANSYNGVEPQATAEKQETQPTPKATTPPSTTASKAEKEELNAREKEILDLLKDAVKRFPNPSSVKIVEIHACAIEGTLYYLTLTSDNNFGGSLTDMYELDDDGAYGSSYSEQQLERMKIALGLVTPSCDASKINKALDEYYSEQGWK